MRGKITSGIKQKSQELLGYEIDQAEIRLMPYMDFVMKNEQRIDLHKISSEEMDILSKWVRKGFILEGVTEKGRPNQSEGEVIVLEKKFYDAVQEILWLGYVLREVRNECG